MAAIPLATSLSFSAPTQTSAYSADCQPSMQNTYPAKAAPGQEMVITTTITNVCVSILVYGQEQVIVDIMLPNTAVILSTAPANPDAVNTIRAPQVDGPWTLDVVASFSDYPLSGVLASFQNTIIINIIGPLASSTTKSSKVYSTIATSSTVKTTKSTTSNSVVVSSTIPPQLLSTMNTPTTSSSSSTSLTPFSIEYLWQGRNGLLILASVIVILSVVIVRIGRRKSE